VQHAVDLMLLLLTMLYSLNLCRYGPFATDSQLSVPNYMTGAVGCQAVSPLKIVC